MEFKAGKYKTRNGLVVDVKYQFHGMFLRGTIEGNPLNKKLKLMNDYGVRFPKTECTDNFWLVNSGKYGNFNSDVALCQTYAYDKKEKCGTYINHPEYDLVEKVL